MPFTTADKMLIKQAKWDARIDAFAGTTLRVRQSGVANAGGSPQSFSTTDSDQLAAMWFVDTEDRTADLVYEEPGEQYNTKWKFYFKSDADVEIHDLLYIKKSGSSWTTASTSDLTHKLKVYKKMEQIADGPITIGIVVMATRMSDDNEDSWSGQT